MLALQSFEKRDFLFLLLKVCGNIIGLLGSLVANNLIFFKHTVRGIYATIRLVILVHTVDDDVITLDSFPFILWLIRLLGL